MDVKPLNDLLIRDSFVLLLAPPAWGKTRILRSLYKDFNRKIIFISPLKALAQEFSEACVELGNIFYIGKRVEADKFYRFLKARRGLLVITPELMEEKFYLEIEGFDDSYLIVLDEFHLFYIWGLDFRPILWESAMGLGNCGLPILGLSATFGDDLIKFWVNDFKREMYLINLGNQVLKNNPAKFYWFWGRKRFVRRFLFEMKKSDGVIIYFCKYRREVDYWVEYFKGKDVLGCKGGEVSTFIENLKLNPKPRCIFTTSALSHGVNLPSISKIFISYKLDDINFWVQMVGRGGRRGEPFELYHFDNNLRSWWGYFKTICFDLLLW